MKLRDMPAPQGDPTFIKNKDRYFMSVATAIARASTHPTVPGGCILTRDREIIGDGRSILASSKVEIDCITYAIGTCAKRGTPTAGAVIYSTRYPFSASVFQAHLMGIRRIVVAAHEWEPYYKDEFRRAARLARELAIAIEPLFDDVDQRFVENPHELDEFDPVDKKDMNDDLATV
jgi:deoxycytidylate deaminase